MRYKSISESLETNISTMMKERNDFLHEIERLKVQLQHSSELEIRISTFTSKFTSLESERDRLMGLNHNLTSEIEILRRELDSVRGS